MIARYAHLARGSIKVRSARVAASICVDFFHNDKCDETAAPP